MFELNQNLPIEVKLLRRHLNSKYAAIVLVFSLVTAILITLRPLLVPYVPNQFRRPIPLWLFSTISVGILLICSFLQTQNDYIFLTKRLGKLSVTVLPFLILLALKPSILPDSYYLRLLPFHVWLGRIFIGFSTFHGILYLNYFYRVGKFFKAFQLLNFFGIIATASFFFTLIVSLHYFRSCIYETFYRCHLILSWISIIIIGFHARPSMWFVVGVTLVLMAWQMIYRFAYGVTTTIQIDRVSDSAQIVTLPRHLFSSYFAPGSHIRISHTHDTSPYFLISASHPYSVASLSSDEKHIKLVVRPSKNFHLYENALYRIHGPYPSIPNEFFLTSLKADAIPRRFLIIAGGVGISFAAPVFKTLKQLGENVKGIWAARSKSELRLFQELELNDWDAYVDANASEDDSPGSDMVYCQKNNIRVFFCRLNIASELDSIAKMSDPKALWIISCGSPSLVKESERIGRSIGATVFSEIYDI
ncbi:hypothetical protein V1514DRAFT_334486 [Lipomyces japonicus]|uniref:uncharacterized protein n=1 Tax=Lipomyces japonicus TaxID=56871 RepID=UPI0034CFEEC6